MLHLNVWTLAFSTNFCPIKTDLSGNTVWQQASPFQKLAKMDNFCHFYLTFVHSKCKRSSLRSQCWMKLSVIFKHRAFLDSGNFCGMFYTKCPTVYQLRNLLNVCPLINAYNHKKKMIWPIWPKNIQKTWLIVQVF